MEELKKIFISHASEDKDTIARPLANLLVESGFRVWFDEFSLKLGDSLKAKIDEGLSLADYGVVILSPSFFSKQWTRDELDGVVAMEHMRKKKVLLPIWHDLEFNDVASYSPTLAGKVAIKSSEGINKVVESIVTAINNHQVFKSSDELERKTIYVPARRDLFENFSKFSDIDIGDIDFGDNDIADLEEGRGGSHSIKGKNLRGAVCIIPPEFTVEVIKREGISWKEFGKQLQKVLEGLDETEKKGKP